MNPVVPLSQIPASPPVDQTGIEERVARFKTRSIKKESKLQALKMALGMMDLTTLEGKDSEGKVRQLCAKARRPHAALPDLPTVAAVCVYPSLVRTAKLLALSSAPFFRASRRIISRGMSLRSCWRTTIWERAGVGLVVITLLSGRDT